MIVISVCGCRGAEAPRFGSDCGEGFSELVGGHLAKRAEVLTVFNMIVTNVLLILTLAVFVNHGVVNVDGGGGLDVRVRDHRSGLCVRVTPVARC